MELPPVSEVHNSCLNIFRFRAEARLFIEMKSMIFIFTCFGIATLKTCPKISEISKEDIKGLSFVGLVKVLEQEARGNQDEEYIDYKVEYRDIYKFWRFKTSILGVRVGNFYKPNPIRIPTSPKDHCTARLEVGLYYVVGACNRMWNMKDALDKCHLGCHIDCVFARNLYIITDDEIKLLRSL
ncbi:hypothetical protein Y032_0661g1276 [Ancylostoma ceylanicum]|uniref:Uncharacterized protein n=1 Tax=Ancylostoma ceylanicum TaxID=53326 RepID=A0A016WJ79_9BILA|nr:hypothetical protein Y032_0661g1276 [Ancylostoma ceylanicum]